jgi:hypothetical protein
MNSSVLRSTQPADIYGQKYVSTSYSFLHLVSTLYLFFAIYCCYVSFSWNTHVYNTGNKSTYVLLFLIHSFYPGVAFWHSFYRSCFFFCLRSRVLIVSYCCPSCLQYRVEITHLILYCYVAQSCFRGHGLLSSPPPLPVSANMPTMAVVQ